MQKKVFFYLSRSNVDVIKEYTCENFFLENHKNAQFCYHIILRFDLEWDKLLSPMDLMKFDSYS